MSFSNKRLYILLLALLLVALPATGLLAQESSDEGEGPPDLEGRTITVAVENAYPPFNYLDDDGAPIGWDYDVINELCARLNCVPEYVETSWDGMIFAVAEGEFDMAADGITILPDRAEQVDFSDPYMTLVQVILGRADEERFSSVEEMLALEDLRLGVQPGTTNYFTAVDLLGSEDDPRLILYDLFPQAVQALIAGDVDAVVMDDVAGQGYVGTNPDAVQIIGEPLTATEELGFIFPLGSDLRDAINAGLDSMREDGSLIEITLRWFTAQEEEDGGEDEAMDGGILGVLSALSVPMEDE
jgi:polar amino acid transport system substrate-binding protein